MLESRFFINKRNGIKQSGASRGLSLLWLVLTLAVSLVITIMPAKAADEQTYTQPFQNSTTTLSGNSITANTYFIKMDYWDVKQATLNLNYQVSQLTNGDTSDVTVSINGVKFYSFRPENKSGLQTKSVDIPTRLLSGTNNIKISGQILNSDGSKAEVAQTPANWFTLYSGANVNFRYVLKDPETAIKSFYDHFSGPDTIVNHNSVISVPKQATNDELTASMYTLAGYARVITTENNQIPVTTFDTSKAKKADYQIVMATYQHLPKKYQAAVSRQDVAKHAVLKTIYDGNKHVLLVTATTGKDLEKAARFIANAELMKETGADTKNVSAATQTFTSDLQYQGSRKLTSTGDQITGPKHQESTYFVNLPTDRTNADGSKIRVHFRYAKNLDFTRSLATVYVNGKPIGSKKLTAANADNDQLTVNLPTGQSLGNSFVIRVAFDLEMKDQSDSDNAQTPWAFVEPDSRAYIKSKPVTDILFSNYPSLFIKNQSFNNLAIVRPKTLSASDFTTMTNIFNLIGNFAQSNTGSIQFYTKTPPKSVLREHHVIAFGTPANNKFIKSLNNKLYFQYNKRFTGFLSNEKLSIESAYGKTVGTNQLLRSPWNKRLGVLVVTAAHSRDVAMASTQINFQRNIQQYTGDAILVDRDNNHYNYRFKKQKNAEAKPTVTQTIHKNSALAIYLGLAFLMIVVIAYALFLMFRKNGQRIGKGGRSHEKQSSDK
ncbi:cellulose biosynthesis cyclic di-GMP-binding regulatory protein BcsB [Furfurilactobacillus cerevisiae]|uniref:cellulose biosynthesis cyclic di-GMP-binding regulatory protein BcsB n=1 Tax=Furfurilactobacillus rossiae TaxID=231049 RepID=UPI003B981864